MVGIRMKIFDGRQFNRNSVSITVGGTLRGSTLARPGHSDRFAATSTFSGDSDGVTPILPNIPPRHGPIPNLPQGDNEERE